jgi:MFS family permease
MSQFRLLAAERFLPLFFTQFLGAFNDNVFKNAIVIFIAFTLADRAGMNSSVLVILAGGIFILPFFLLSATAGQIADRFEKSLLIRHIKTAEIVIMVMGAAAFVLQSVWLLMFILFLMGAQSTFFGPLKYGILPQHLAESELTGGNGLIQMGPYIAILGGTMLGGVLIAIGEAGPLVTGVTVIAIAVAGRVASAYIPVAAPSDPGLRVDLNVFRQTARIMGFALESRAVFIAVIAISWFWFTGATFLSLVPTYARDVISGNELVATLLLTAFSVGIGTGSLLCEKLSRGCIEPGLVPIGALGICLAGVDLHFSEIVNGTGGLQDAAAFLGAAANWRVIADLTLIGLFGGVYIVPLYAMVQSRSAPAHRARIIAANNVLNALFMVVSALLVIGLVQLGFTPQDVFLMTGLATAAVAVALCLALPEFALRCRAWLKGMGSE